MQKKIKANVVILTIYHTCNCIGVNERQCGGVQWRGGKTTHIKHSQFYVSRIRPASTTNIASDDDDDEDDDDEDDDDEEEEDDGY
jgi:hypothetical protein